METINYTSQLFSSVCSHLLSKCLVALLYIVYSFTFNEGHHVAMVSILILIIFDFITGLTAVKINGEEIKSSKIRRSALKVLFYFLLISSGNLAEKAVGINFFLDETIMGFLAATELISIIENVGRIGFAVPKKMLNKLEKFRDSK